MTILLPTQDINMIQSFVQISLTLLTIMEGYHSKSHLNENQEEKDPGTSDFCQMETFKANCAENEIIMMKSARYGRMRLGRCLTRNYYVGCSADVLPHLDTICSGRHSCQVPIPDPTLFQAQPCPKDLVAYLEAKYECMPVTYAEPTLCNNQPIHIDSASGYISNQVTISLGVGSARCPWHLEAEPGQRFSISLLDFTAPKQKSESGGKDSCRHYGYILERHMDISLRMCGKRGNGRETHLYNTESNIVDIVIARDDSDTASYSYLIQYQVIGCPMPEPPDGAIVEVTGDMAAIRCNNSQMTFHLVCSGTKWTGPWRNCTEGAVYPDHHQQPATGAMSLGLFIAISIGVALGVILGIGMLTFVYSCYTRRKLNRKTTWRNEENVLLKEPGAATCNEPQYIVTKLGAGGASMTMPSSECDKYHKAFIPMMPLHMSHGDHLYESTRVSTSTFGMGSAQPLNSDDMRPIGVGSNNAQECDSGVDASSGLEPSDIQFVDILKPSLQQQQQQQQQQPQLSLGGAAGSASRVPRTSDFHIYSHEDYPRVAQACHFDTIICPIHQCHHHQQQQQQQQQQHQEQLRHSVHSLIGAEDDTS